MSTLNKVTKQYKTGENEMSAFRSSPKTVVVNEAVLMTANIDSLSSQKDVKVSEFRLEQYLNACSPTCHG